MDWGTGRVFGSTPFPNIGGIVFKPKVLQRDIEFDGEKFTVYAKRPTGAQILDLPSQEDETTKRTKRENAEHLFRSYACNADGSALSDEQVGEMMEWDYEPMLLAADAVNAMIARRTEAKNDSAPSADSSSASPLH